MNSKRLSHFGSVAFLGMLVDSAFSIFILSQTEYSTTYPGLLFSMLFFGGLSVLLFSNYGLHPQLSPFVLLLAVGPELINIYVVNDSSYPAIVMTALTIVLALEPNFPKWLRNGLIIVGISCLQLTKLDEIGTYFVEITRGTLSAASIILVVFYIIYRYFAYAATRSLNNNIIAPDFVIDMLKNKIGSDYKYKFQPGQGEFLTSEVFAPIQSALPYLAEQTQKGYLETIPLMRLYLIEGMPVLETTNIVANENLEELNYANLKLTEQGYEIILLDEQKQGLVVAPKQISRNWKKNKNESVIGSTEEIQDSNNLQWMNQEDGQQVIIEPVKEATLESESLEAETAVTNEQEENKSNHDKFRERRKFDPKGGQGLKRIRNITKEEGTDDFQWNVPSK